MYLQSVVVADPLCVLQDLVVGEEVEGAVAAQAKDLPARRPEAPRVARRGHPALELVVSVMQYRARRKGGPQVA